jgi:hypothetical protein
MVIRIAIYALVMTCFARYSDGADVSSVINRSMEVFDKQIAIKLPVGVAFSTETSQQFGNQNLEESHVSVFSGESGAGIDASYSREKKGKESVLYVAIVNPEYGAVATLKNKTQLNSPFALTALVKQGFSLDTYWQNGESTKHWLENSVKMKMTSRYFNLGNTEFSKAIKEWKSRNGKVDFNEGAGSKKLYELRFSDWPVGDDGKMTYRIDPETFAISEIEGTFGGTQVKLEVLEFAIFQNIPFPKKTLLTNRQASGDTLLKRCEWKEATVESVGFKPDQLYLPFYGLPHPDLGALPSEKRSWIYLYALAGVVLFVGLFMLKRYRN